MVTAFWVNTVSPLQTVNDIKNFVNLSQGKDWKSGVSVNTASVHAIFDNDPLNFEWVQGFSRTQDLKPLKTFNYAMMGWSRCMINLLKEEVNYLMRTLISLNHLNGVVFY